MLRGAHGTFNLYGRIVTKKSRGCSYFYELLCTSYKTDGWTNPELKLIAEMTNYTDNLDYENDSYMKYVKQILKMPYLNRLRQFLLRLLRNNLLLGNRAKDVKNDNNDYCYICNDHRETRTALFLGCTIVQERTNFLIRVLNKAGFLKKGSKLSFFFFEHYGIDTIENITLATLWKYTYDNKYNEETLQNIPFAIWLKKTVSSLSAFPPPLALDAGRVHDVLNLEMWGNTHVNSA